MTAYLCLVLLYNFSDIREPTSVVSAEVSSKLLDLLLEMEISFSELVEDSLLVKCSSFSPTLGYSPLQICRLKYIIFVLISHYWSLLKDTKSQQNNIVQQ